MKHQTGYYAKHADFAPRVREPRQDPKRLRKQRDLEVEAARKMKRMVTQ